MKHYKFFITSAFFGIAVVVSVAGLLLAGSGDAHATSVVLREAVKLSSQNNSGQTGELKLQQLGSNIEAKLEVTPLGTVAQPTHIHKGTCDAVGAVVYPLTSVVRESTTILNGVTFETLKSQLPLVVNVHKSAQESNVYTSCGTLTVSEVMEKKDDAMKREDNVTVKKEDVVVKKIENKEQKLSDLERKIKKLELDENDLGDVNDRSDDRQAAFVGRNGRTVIFNAVIKEFTSATTSTSASFTIEVWFHRLRVFTTSATVMAPAGATLNVGDRINVKGRMTESGVEAQSIFNRSAHTTNVSTIQLRIKTLLEEVERLRKLLLPR